jgi:hypothetical protein
MSFIRAFFSSVSTYITDYAIFLASGILKSLRNSNSLLRNWKATGSRLTTFLVTS